MKLPMTVSNRLLIPQPDLQEMPLEKCRQSGLLMALKHLSSWLEVVSLTENIEAGPITAAILAQQVNYLPSLKPAFWQKDRPLTFTPTVAVLLGSHMFWYVVETKSFNFYWTTD